MVKRWKRGGREARYCESEESEERKYNEIREKKESESSVVGEEEDGELDDELSKRDVVKE